MHSVDAVRMAPHAVELESVVQEVEAALVVALRPLPLLHLISLLLLLPALKLLPRHPLRLALMTPLRLLFSPLTSVIILLPLLPPPNLFPVLVVTLLALPPVVAQLQA